MNLSDRELLARTLQAEAGNQGLGGMLAAGSVIMNRANTSGYGNGVRGVILKPGQFSAWNSLTGYAGGEQGQDMANMQASTDAYAAADRLLAGKYTDPTGGATHYYNPAISQPKWGGGDSWKRIGDHVFGSADAGRGGQAPQITTSTKGPQMMQEQKPQGLLGSLGIQKRDEAAGGETAQPFYQRDTFKDTAAVLAQGFGRMGIMGMEEIADDIAKQRTEAKAKNKTMEALSKMNTPQAQAAVEYINAGGDAVSALKMAFTPAKADSTAMMKNYEFFISKGMSPEQAMTAVKSGNTINMGDVGDGNFLYGSKAGLPQGWRLDTRTGQAGVIPGGPAAVEAETAAAEAERRQAALDARTGQTGSVIDSKVDSLVGMLEKGGIFDFPEAGIFGNVLGSLGINQEARTFRNEIKAIQSIIAFDQLAKMRAASKTGGALGAITERELDLLMSAYGSLDQSTDPKVLAQNLRDIKKVMGMIENDPVASQFYYGQGGSSPAQTQSNGVSVGEPY